MPYKAFIFDVDGTIAETEEYHRQSFNRAFQKFGLDWHWDRDLYIQLLKTAGGKERMRAYAQSRNEPIKEGLLHHIHQWKTQNYTLHLREKALPLREGIADLFQWARNQDKALAIATTTNLPNVEALISSSLNVNFLEYFDDVAAGDMVQNKKPAPDVYELAVKKLNLEPEECLAFEDSWNGVQSAKAAGLKVMACPSVYGLNEDLSDADFLVKSFAHAFEYLMNTNLIKREEENGCYPPDL